MLGGLNKTHCAIKVNEFEGGLQLLFFLGDLSPEGQNESRLQDHNVP